MRADPESVTRDWFEPVWNMRLRHFTIGLAVAAQCACASAPRTHAFRDLPHYIEQGSSIRLTDTSGQTTTGRLDTLSPASLRLLTDDRPRDVPEHLVAKIERRERQVGRGALIGLGVGFGVGLIAARSQESSGNPLIDTQAAGLTLAAATVLGTAAGAIAGAVLKVYRTVYQAPKPSASAPDQWSRYRATSTHRPATITRSTVRTAAMSRVGSPLYTTRSACSPGLSVPNSSLR